MPRARDGVRRLRTQAPASASYRVQENAGETIRYDAVQHLLACMFATQDGYLEGCRIDP